MLPVTDEQATWLEAAAFRRLVAHLQSRTDVQNIDLMNLAGFCRNCLGNWVEEAARDAAIPLSKAQAREHVYGMPQDDWKARYQRDATPAQASAFSHATHNAPGEPARTGEADRSSPAARAAES